MKIFNITGNTPLAHESITSVAVGLNNAKREATRIFKDHPTVFEVIVIDRSVKNGFGHYKIIRQIRKGNDKGVENGTRF